MFVVASLPSQFGGFKSNQLGATHELLEFRCDPHDFEENETDLTTKRIQFL